MKSGNPDTSDFQDNRTHAVVVTRLKSGARKNAIRRGRGLANPLHIHQCTPDNCRGNMARLNARVSPLGEMHQRVGVPAAVEAQGLIDLNVAGAHVETR